MSPNQPILWVHGDCLDPHSPCFAAYPGRPALWVWDETLLTASQISLKRLVFLYECLLDLPVVIRRGDPAQVILTFAQEQGTNWVVTTDSPSPRFQQICDGLTKHLRLDVLAVEPFLAYEGYLDLKRFSRYWRAAQRHVLKPQT
ncbi:MAG: hypothetical protein IGQ88_12340 [Gloeomargaritaceae cyanobacterium C42_A2020_066]|nr:hypothetical protein [Gloeomargaritaceae cyanobacterium C42_A2020_066]